MTEIFVFGSNLAGRHGAGAALTAVREHSAITGRGYGRQGNSYGIPTKGHQLEILRINAIKSHVDLFLDYARSHPELTFKVTRIGCGLSGFEDSQIAPMFYHAPNNCLFDGKWSIWLGTEYTYWGTF